MVAFLSIIAVLAFGNAIFGVFELIQTWRPGATVFQQISARVDIGLSMLTMATAGGLASLLKQSEAQTAALVAGFKALGPGPASAPAAGGLTGAQPSLMAKRSSPASASSDQQADASVRMHRGVPFYLVNGEYVATVRGQEIKAPGPDQMRERITAALNG